jgi:formylglycine-generating enzyme required for sulfatase activity
VIAEISELKKLWSPGRIWSDGVHLPSMIDLPIGFCFMGERADDKFSTAVERPRHRVEIARPIALGRFPVTVAQYSEFAGSALDEEGSLPVVSISWEDATAYCEWLSLRTGHHYRLPSEAEWEYACRAGRDEAFPTGETLTPALANYLYDEHGTKVGPGRRTLVGSYPANAFGLHDMAGNVCEWVFDAWHAHFDGAPSEGQSWGGGAATELRVLRGGAWDYLPRLLRSSWRDYLPQHARRDNVGFRVACAITEQAEGFAA